jgi:hypothetical protein
MDENLTDIDIAIAELLAGDHQALVLASALAARMDLDEQPLADVLLPFVMMAYAEARGAMRRETHDDGLCDAAVGLLDAAYRLADILAGSSRTAGGAPEIDTSTTH